jgi:hypothetical protein
MLRKGMSLCFSWYKVTKEEKTGKWLGQLEHIHGQILVSLLVSSNAPWETTKVYLVLYVCCVDRCSSFCTFSFDHCVVYSDIRILIVPLVSSKSSLQFPQYQGQRETTGVYFDNSLRTKNKGKQPGLVLRKLSKYTPVVSLCSWYWKNCQNILRLFPFVLGSERIVKIYFNCFQQRETTGVYFDNFLSTKDKGKHLKYILTIPSEPRTKGNNRSIFWQFFQYQEQREIVKIYSSCFPLFLVLRKLSKYTPVVFLCPWY